ncbi:hypothetical protein CERSUDRAFT_100602 [Gelatoporia subvermispora B]|uniref:Uncharacterized protein n=1 Tax=Ceriporiopsis subvermispora (strain B) TaxID=914234 RepID=M2QZ92_CERS8|nr:hypothetical protein CERSUDRAFT_100602 [Gelatoporia subvermispora B]
MSRQPVCYCSRVTRRTHTWSLSPALCSVRPPRLLVAGSPSRRHAHLSSASPASPFTNAITHIGDALLHRCARSPPRARPPRCRPARVRLERGPFSHAPTFAVAPVPSPQPHRDRRSPSPRPQLDDPARRAETSVDLAALAISYNSRHAAAVAGDGGRDAPAPATADPLPADAPNASCARAALTFACLLSATDASGPHRRAPGGHARSQCRLDVARRIAPVVPTRRSVQHARPDSSLHPQRSRHPRTRPRRRRHRRLDGSCATLRNTHAEAAHPQAVLAPTHRRADAPTRYDMSARARSAAVARPGVHQRPPDGGRLCARRSAHAHAADRNAVQKPTPPLARHTRVSAQRTTVGDSARLPLARASCRGPGPGGRAGEDVNDMALWEGDHRPGKNVPKLKEQPGALVRRRYKVSSEECVTDRRPSRLCGHSSEHHP